MEQPVNPNPKLYSSGNDIRYMETDVEVLRLETAECISQRHYIESSKLQEKAKRSSKYAVQSKFLLIFHSGIYGCLALGFLRSRYTKEICFISTRAKLNHFVSCEPDSCIKILSPLYEENKVLMIQFC
jgi:hypothetical protein